MFCFLRINFKINFDVYICFIQVIVDKWMDISEMGYVIASRYNVILVSLSQQQSMTFFPLRMYLIKMIVIDVTDTNYAMH